MVPFSNFLATSYCCINLNCLFSMFTQSQVREEGVCSPGFLAGLRGRYDSNAREKERLIQREIAKRDFHQSKNLEATKDIDERIKKHLSITEVQLCHFAQSYPPFIDGLML